MNGHSNEDVSTVLDHHLINTLTAKIEAPRRTSIFEEFAFNYASASAIVLI